MININLVSYNNNFKTITGKDFFQNIILKFEFYIKKNLPKYILYNNFNLELNFKFKSITYNISILNINSLDSIYNYNNIIRFILPVILKNNKTNKSILINLIISELPLIDMYSTLLINGIKRTLVTKLIRNEGLYYNSFIKENRYLYKVQVLIEKEIFKLNIIVDIKILKIFINIENLNITIDLIHFFYFSGIYSDFIISHSRYGNTFIMHNILYNSIKSIEKEINKDNFIHKFIIIYKTICNLRYLNLSTNKVNNNYEYSYLIFILDYLLDFSFNKKVLDDKDHFGNKKLNSLEKEFENYININISKFLNLISIININKFIEKNTLKLNTILKPNNLILYTELLLLNPLLKITDDTNIISEICNLNKIQNSGVLSLTSINSSPLYLRDIRSNQLGRFCLINTSEGPSSGLILSTTLNTFTDINKQLKTSFHTHFFRKYNINNYININIKEQESYAITFEEISLKKELNFNTFIVPILIENNFTTITLKQNKILNTNFTNLIGPSENLIPFIFHNEPTRCFMGAKMQTQSVPLLFKKCNLVLSGYEYIFPNIYSESIKALQEGIITYVSSYKIIIRDILNRDITYYNYSYKISNNKIVKYQKPIVWVGEHVFIGQLLTENNSTKNEELSLGNPLLVMYGSYFGYDYEDSIIISQKLIFDNIFTSLHIDIYETIFNYNEINIEYSTLIVPELSIFSQRNLNILGIVKEGSKVLEGDLIVSKLIKEELILNIEDSLTKLIINLFGNFLINTYNKSKLILKGDSGRVLKIEIFLEKKYKIQYLMLRIFIGKIRVIELGDKLCGRHGNKGIISYITKESDMPYLVTGEMPDIITSSLGVPSRMNIGQLYEGLVGLSCLYFNKKILINYRINNILGVNYIRLLIYKYLYETSVKTSFKNLYNPYEPGKLLLRDGRSGNFIQNSICLGVLQFYKLIHMVKDKINFRTTSKYTQLLQQPTRGRFEGGQRFGEMEIWALEAFGVAYTIRELLSFKSDDITAREYLFKLLMSGKDVLTNSSISETFKVTLKELQSLAINIDLYVIYPNIEQNLKTKIF